MPKTIVCAIVAIHCGAVQAQYRGPGYDYNRSASGHVYTVGEQTITSNVGLNEISATAFRHFAKNYSFLPNANWVKTSDGFTVTARDRNQIHYRIIFGRHGSMLYEMRYYRHASIPTSMKDFIEHRFEGAIILGLPEMTIGSRTSMCADIYVNGIEKIIQLSTYELKVLAQFGSAARPLETLLLLRGLSLF